MKIFLVLTTLLNLVVAAAVTKEKIKYTYKANSNTAYVGTFWQTEPCIDYNSFSIFAADGYTKQSGSSKVTIKSVEGSLTYYSKCVSTGATRTDISFYSTEPVSGLLFRQLNNVTILTNITAFSTKAKCVIQSYTYPDSDSSEETYSYYVCGDPYESKNKKISIDTIMKATTGVDADEYTSIEKGVERHQGYILKYESNQRCKSTSITKNIIKINKQVPISIAINSDNTDSNICKVSSGYTERILFT
jgi:hypothetical protein